MLILTIHYTESEEVFGMVYAVTKTSFDDFDNEVRRTWKTFEEENEDFSIEDYVEYHNDNSNIKIDWPVHDFIQL